MEGSRKAPEQLYLVIIRKKVPNYFLVDHNIYQFGACSYMDEISC